MESVSYINVRGFLQVLRSVRFATTLLVSIVGLAACGVSLAQSLISTASISGVVTDPTGTIVAKAACS